jgi:hypothetical protein
VVVVVRVAGANGDSLTNQSTAGILELPRYTTVLVLGTWGLLRLDARDRVMECWHFATRKRNSR